MAARKQLTKEEIEAIKEAYKTNSSREVAKMFNIAPVTVRYHGGAKPVIKKSTEERNKQMVVAVSNRRRKIKEELVAYKGGSCERCGYDRYIGALEFHHKDPSEKDFALAKKGATRSIEILKKEVDKCNLLCANCHREVHEEIRLTK